jgi:hypothetical protein
MGQDVAVKAVVDEKGGGKEVRAIEAGDSEGDNVVEGPEPLLGTIVQVSSANISAIL